MKRILVLPVLIMFSILSHADIEKFFIGTVEVSKEDYISLDSTFLRSRGVWRNGDMIRYVVEPNVYSRIDSSVPGVIRVVRKTDEEIAVIDSILNAYRTASAILKVGDTIPDFTFYDYQFPEREPWSYRELLKGNVILLNFWATWCGPCVEELKSEHLPALMEEFNKYDNFIFLPVSVNHSSQELIEFFDSPRGEELSRIESKTAWDRNGEFSETLSNGGIPLTILIDKDGVIRFNEAGAFLNSEQKTRLRKTIADLLQTQD